MGTDKHSSPLNHPRRVSYDGKRIAAGAFFCTNNSL